MMDTREQIATNAESLRDLNRRIHETFARRGLSNKDRGEWSNACAQFHSNYDLLFYPGGEQRWVAFLARDSSEVETAIAFLEVDPYFFRSGYMKQVMWNRLKSIELTTSQSARLEEVAIQYVHGRIRREFWHMARFVRLRASGDFWLRIDELRSAKESSVQIKAEWLTLARRNWPVRGWINGEMLRAHYKADYLPQLDFRARVEAHVRKGRHSRASQEEPSIHAPP